MAPSEQATLAVTESPAPSEQDEVLALVERSAQADGHRAVNEAGLLALRTGAAEQPRPVHVLAREPTTGQLIGYAQAVWEPDGPVAALVVDPARRRRGLGSALWRSLAAHTPAPLRVWASGNDPSARALAARQGLTPVRTLLVLGRSLAGDLPPTEPPTGVSIRTFRPGDEAGWLTTNARAFAGHPEQGSMTLADLEQRMAEPWFDPAGLFLAVRDTDNADNADNADNKIIGFHWTKLEAGSSTGEVYVIGVDPTARVRGLGTPLLGAGLRHLRDRGATDVDLYVEADNVRALALYHRYGFAAVSADVMYASPATSAGAPA